MRILTFNIERLKHHKHLAEIQALLMAQNADVLILTESDTRIELAGYEARHSTFVPTFLCEPKNREPIIGHYKETERRISILSKYPIIDTIPIFDDTISLACKIESPFGEVVVYGTVLGLSGKADKNITTHLAHMKSDWQTLASRNHLIIAGDFNITFSNTYYTTKSIRVDLQDFFIKHKLINLTAGLPNCIDHIVLSQQLVVTDNGRICKSITMHNFEVDKRYSDHFGVLVGVE